MVNFTTLIKRGKRSFIDKYLKKRHFGRCYGCEGLRLLIEYFDKENTLLLCEKCYNTLLNEGET
jgi:hypothetical protein